MNVKFIEVTDMNTNHRICINVDRILTAYPAENGNGTIISFGIVNDIDVGYRVWESLDTVKKLIGNRSVRSSKIVYYGQPLSALRTDTQGEDADYQEG